MHYFAFSICPDGVPVWRPSAHAGVWINNPICESARRQAERLLRESGWRPLRLLENHPVSRADYCDGDEGLPYYEQALIDGEVLVLFVVEE